MRRPSPEAVGLAEVAAFAVDVAFAAMLLAFAVDRYAPPQDLAWKPFSLDEPLGLATAAKLERVQDDPAACRAALTAGGVAFREAERRETGFCSTANAVRLGAGSRLSPAGPTMTCPLALTYALWSRQIAQPAARALLDAEITTVDHLGTYACRTIYGRPGARPSQHATAGALDVSGFHLSDGRRITVARNFRDPGPEGRFLRVTRGGACRLFGATLSPDYNAAHADHLHLDMSRYKLCR
ncbi:MAG: extensin family protein [Caulobacterales bacterium 68-7]|nr:extensin family protein [Caulobacterales bacterium]OJU12191.1 MAG: extensin family protein [Caulobacterales bacterium 68-7]